MQVYDRKDVKFIVESMMNIKDMQEVQEVL